MPSLQDIDDKLWVQKIKLRGVEIDFYPLTIDNLFYLFGKFPSLYEILDSDQQVRTQGLLKLPDSTTILSEIASCSTGHQGDEKEVAKAKRLGAHEQVSIAKQIIEVTMPEGLRPFLEEVAELAVFWKTSMQIVSAQQPTAQDGAPLSANSSSATITAELVGTPRPMRRRHRPDASPPSTQPPKPNTPVASPISPSP